jgi:hypothetical protein
LRDQFGGCGGPFHGSAICRRNLLDTPRIQLMLPELLLGLLVVPLLELPVLSSEASG